MGRASEIKDEISFRYAHIEVRTQVVMISDPTRYQLDHGGALHTHQYWHTHTTNRDINMKMNTTRRQNEPEPQRMRRSKRTQRYKKTATALGTTYKKNHLEVHTSGSHCIMLQYGFLSNELNVL